MMNVNAESDKTLGLTNRVTVTGIDIPFGDLVALGIKVGIALIPVGIMLGILGFVFTAMFAGCTRALMK